MFTAAAFGDYKGNPGKCPLIDMYVHISCHMICMVMSTPYTAGNVRYVMKYKYKLTVK